MDPGLNEQRLAEKPLGAELAAAVAEAVAAYERDAAVLGAVPLAFLEPLVPAVRPRVDGHP